MRVPISTRSQAAQQLLLLRRRSVVSSLFPCSTEPVGNERRDFLREQNHAQNHRNRSQYQNIAKHSSSDRALFCTMLLPKSERDQGDRDPQQQGAKRCEKGTCSTSPQSRSETDRQAATDRCDGTRNRCQRSRDPRSLFHHYPHCRASNTAR